MIFYQLLRILLSKAAQKVVITTKIVCEATSLLVSMTVSRL